jgi:hypothetical protein
MTTTDPLAENLMHKTINAQQFVVITSFHIFSILFWSMGKKSAQDHCDK